MNIVGRRLMKTRKILCLILTLIMVISSIPFLTFADEQEVWNTYTTESGLSISLPKTFDQVMWDAMPEDSPVLKKNGFTKDVVIQNYKYYGMVFQGSTAKVYEESSLHGLIAVVMVFEKDAPATPDEASLRAGCKEKMEKVTQASFNDPKYFGSGVVDINGVTLYKVFCQTSEKSNIRLYQYSLVTDTGKQYEINIAGVAADQNTGKTLPFPENSDAAMDKFTSSIINNIKFSDELASHAVKLEGEAFRMMTGDYRAAATLESIDTTQHTAAASDAQNKWIIYTTKSGVSVALPPECDQTIWNNIPADSTTLKECGITREEVDQTYKGFGLELQSPQDAIFRASSLRCLYSMINVFEKKAPATVDEASLISQYKDKLSQVYPNTFDDLKYFGAGTVNINGLTLFKIFCQTSKDPQIRLYQYSLITDKGLLYEIDIVNHTIDPDSNKDLPFPENSDAAMDKFASSIINNIKFSDDQVSHAVKLEGEPFKMTTGDYPAAVTLESIDTTKHNGVAAPDSTAAGNADTNKTLYEKFIAFEFPMGIILAALVLLLLLGCTLPKKKEWQDEPLGMDSTKAIKGFATVSIIIHHLCQELMGRADVLAPFSEFGVLFVGIFFFFSGYGLYTSLKTKEDYLKGFLKKRLTTILVPYFVCILVFIVSAFIRGRLFSPFGLLKALTGWDMLNQHTWYIVEITILYVAFFIIYKLIKNRNAATVVMTVFVLIMMAGSLLLGHGENQACDRWFQGEWWYNATLLFIFGIIVSQNADALRKFARKFYSVLLIIFGWLTVGFYFLTHNALMRWSYWSETPEDPKYLDKLRCLGIQLPWILFFVCFVLLVMMKVKFGNPILKFLGSISLELYLVHNLFVMGLKDNSIASIPSASMYIVLTVLLSIGLAAVVSGVDKYLIALILGKKKSLSDPDEVTLNKNSGRIYSIDVMRVVMAFLVVCIHMPFAGVAGNVFKTFGKVAVPFFLAVCGYMLYRDDSQEMMKRLIKQTKRILIFYIGSVVFYVLANILYIVINTGSIEGAKQLYTAKTIPDFLLYNYLPFAEHLWFFGSLLYALIIMLILNKLKVLKNAIFAGPVLIAAYVVLSHLGIGEAYQLRNAILVGLSYTMTGMIIRRFEDKLLKIKYITPILGILLVICCTCAIVELNVYKQGTDVPFISCEIMTFVLLLLCLRFKDFGKGTFMAEFGRTCSLPIYIMHIFVLMFLQMLIPFNTGFFMNYGAVTVFAITAVLVFWYESIKKAIVEAKHEK